jgi:hypothetical protein
LPSKDIRDRFVYSALVYLFAGQLADGGGERKPGEAFARDEDLAQAR